MPSALPRTRSHATMNTTTFMSHQHHSIPVFSPPLFHLQDDVLRVETYHHDRGRLKRNHAQSGHGDFLPVSPPATSIFRHSRSCTMILMLLFYVVQVYASLRSLKAMQLSWCAGNYISGSRTTEIYKLYHDSRNEQKHTFYTDLSTASLTSWNNEVTTSRIL
jgi:hypothetical protein